MQTDATDKAKQHAAKKAVDFIADEMTVGLGTGSTASHFVIFLSQRVKAEGLKLRCVCTSEVTEKLARERELEVVDISTVDKIDVTVDGADYIDSNKRLIKGYGGALTREKIVAYSSEKMIVIAEPRKRCEVLSGRVPVEFLPFAKEQVRRDLRTLGATSVELREKGGGVFITDNKMQIFDALFENITQPQELENRINQIPGVLENGIFSRAAYKVILGLDEGVEEY
jgi:ribose 5-phosphate isomerase A